MVSADGGHDREGGAEGLATDVLGRVKELGVTIQGSVLGQISNAFSFTMGLAWKAFSLQAVSGVIAEPAGAQVNILGMWIAALTVTLICVPLIVLVSSHRTSLQQEAKEAEEAGRVAESLRKRTWERSYEVLLSWALAFIVASQIDSAVKVSLPATPVAWRVLYFLFSLAVYGLPVYAIREFWGSKSSTVSNLADVLVSGAGFAFALSFQTALEGVAGMDSVATTEDLTKIVSYCGVFILVSGVILAAVGAADAHDLAVKEAAMRGEAAPQASGWWTCMLCSGPGPVMRALTAGGVSFAAANALYSITYLVAARIAVPDRSVSIFVPLGVAAASAVLVICLAMALILGALVTPLQTRASALLDRLDGSLIPGNVDDAIIVVLQSTSKTFFASISTAMAWTTGCALHGFWSALWQEYVASNANIGEGLELGLAFAYSALVTLIGVVVAFVAPPPPKATQAKVEKADDGDVELTGDS